MSRSQSPNAEFWQSGQQLRLLDREIADEERCVGIDTTRPLTDATIVHRRVQIAGLLLVCGFTALFATDGQLATGVVLPQPK